MIHRTIVRAVRLGWSIVTSATGSVLVLSIVILGVVATAATSGRVIIVPALVTATPAVPPALATGETGSGLVVWFVSVAITLFGIDLAGMLRRNRRNT